MHFQHIELRGFGTLSNVTLSELNPGLNVFYGGNGSGKTTLLHFLRGMLSGFQEAYRLRLLPPLSGGQPGGSLRLSDASGRFDVIRHARPGHADTLAINVSEGNAAAVATLRKRLQDLSPDVVQSVFAVGGYESRNLDQLVACATAAQIDLRSVQRPAGWIETRLQRVAQERADLFSGSPAQGQIPELERQQQELKSRIEAAKQSQQRHTDNQQQAAGQLRSDIERRQQEVDWLCQELQAVEADISEVNDRLWSTRETVVRSVESAPQPAEVRPALWTDEVRRIDNEIAHAQQVLRDLAASRHRLSLAHADFAGAESTDPAADFQRQRQALAAIERQTTLLSEFLSRRSAGQADASCFCQPLATEVGVALQAIREQIWSMCQELSRQQTAHEQSLLGAQRAGVDRCERELVRQIRCLRVERERLLKNSAATPSQQAAFRTVHEARHCDCPGHADSLPDPRTFTETRQPAAREIVREEVVTVSRARPGDRELRQTLAERRDQLRKQLLDGIARLRAARTELERLEQAGGSLADDRTLQSLRYEYAVVEQKLADQREQWESLALLQSVLQSTHQKLTQEAASPVIEEASAWLARMTGGRYPGFRFHGESRELRVINAAGTELSAGSLSRGTLEHAVLSFRLALSREFARRGVQLPLMLDDVLADSDQDRLRAAAAALVEFSAEQQVLFFTCQEHLAELFETLNVAVRLLPGAQRQRSATISRLAPQPADGELPETRSPRTSSRPVMPELMDRVQPDEPFWLQVDSPIQYVPSLGEQMSRRLGSLGLRTVLDLIELDPEIAEIPLESLQIAAATLRLWQAEARLLCCVPDLTGRDAQLLVACGVYSPAELAECGLEDLWGRMQRLRQQQEADLALPWLSERSDWPGREALARWIQRGRASRSLRRARDWAIRRQASRRDGSVATVSPVAGQARSFRLHTKSDPHEPAAVNEVEREWRHYLRMDSPIVDAPSIGPRTAERLEAVGILNVANLIHCDAEEIARRLNRRELTAAVIETWKRQAELMCRVPELRGHDVQVLVACGIVDAETLARFTPEQLYAQVGPFARSREGQRLLRSSRTPDLDEVTDWIACARQAEPQFRAA